LLLLLLLLLLCKRLCSLQITLLLAKNKEDKGR